MAYSIAFFEDLLGKSVQYVTRDIQKTTSQFVVYIVTNKVVGVQVKRQVIEKREDESESITKRGGLCWMRLLRRRTVNHIPKKNMDIVRPPDPHSSCFIRRFKVPVTWEYNILIITMTLVQRKLLEFQRAFTRLSEQLFQHVGRKAVVLQGHFCTEKLMILQTFYEAPANCFSTLMITWRKLCYLDWECIQQRA